MVSRFEPLFTQASRCACPLSFATRVGFRAMVYMTRYICCCHTAQLSGKGARQPAKPIYSHLSAGHPVHWQTHSEMSSRAGTVSSSQRGHMRSLEMRAVHDISRTERPLSEVITSLPCKSRPTLKHIGPRIHACPPTGCPSVSDPADPAALGSSCRPVVGAPVDGLGAFLRSSRKIRLPGSYAAMSIQQRMAGLRGTDTAQTIARRGGAGRP